MWKLLQIELFKIFKRPRTYIPFGAIAAMILIIQVGLKFDGRSYVELVLTSLSDTFNVPYTLIMNGYLAAFVILNTLLIQVPLLVALVAGDTVAGEANMGTLRLLVTRPVSRTQLMLVKFGASVIYTILLLLWMAMLALFLSMWVFGTNDMILARDNVIEHIREADVLWRYFAAFGYATVALTTVAALAFLLSVFAENSIGPIVATISIVIVLTILSQMRIPLYDNTVNPWLFTSHMLAWKGFFYLQSDGQGGTIDGSVENLSSIFRSLTILLVYIVLFVTAAIWAFRKKDILS
ncbi:ABC transporter permease subunit [Flavitalea sp. BT771]|uniref:ABC transporter permease n=1 Tax=Flavitalea sp. BT771 TaxID=3063329 RepID=UPI0026E331F9|nr:ABC transporter permease subunit [Flavitalea sp. BT771]MDO6433998.1 ABC transporter permease subunit [Flavitalea sp. BT771]MDV6222898.1 ABC transporter permease subunit [Flavitalea sp. BT771]